MSMPFNFEVTQKEDGRYCVELKDFNLNFDDVATADQFAATMSDALNKKAAEIALERGPQWSCSECGNSDRTKFRDIKRQECDDDIECMECGSLSVEESPELAMQEMAKKYDSLRAAVIMMKTGSCWCPKGIDTPYVYDHTTVCSHLRSMMQRE